MAKNFEISPRKGSVEAVLRPPRPNKIILFGLFFLVLVSFSFPLSILFIAQLDIGFGFTLTIAIFWGTAIYFLRKLLWTVYGREVFEIDENKVKHFFDYGLFKDGFRVLKFESLKVGYAEIEKPSLVFFIDSQNLVEDTLCYLIIFADGEVVQSHLPTTLGYVNKLSKILKMDK